MNRILSLLPLLALPLFAGPVEFGREQANAAIAARGLKLLIETELNLDPPGTFRIVTLRSGARVSGGDLRGLMYGLLEAAVQIRATGQIKAVTFKPTIRQRAVRMAPSDADLAAPDYFLADRWRNYFRMLAENRINRFVLVLPPDRSDLDRIRFLSSTATDYGVDFILGIRGPLGDPKIQGKLRELLDESVLVRGIQLQPANEPVDFYLNSVFSVIKGTGRRVTLDLHASESRPQLALAAIGLGIPLTLPPGAKLGNAEHEFHTLLPADGIGRIKALAAGVTAVEVEAPSGQPVENRRFYEALNQEIP